ncbi:MAG: hypothetical protein ACYC0Y_28690 [Pirellulales bacterium]
MKSKHRYNVVIFRGAQVERILPLRLGYNKVLNWIAQFNEARAPEENTFAAMLPCPQSERQVAHA